MEKLNIKPLTKEQILISADRLTRFKNTETKYLRVFFDIINHNLISPIYNKKELEKTDYAIVASLATKIINYSLETIGLNHEQNLAINKRLLEYEKSIFKFDKEVEKLLNNKINYRGIIHLTDKTSSQNLHWLKSIDTDSEFTDRERYGLKFPIEFLIIAEGATEEILLPELSRLCGLDFDKKGIYILSAGGKNQVVKLYYELAETLKLPIFILLDKDGVKNSLEIKPKLRPTDKIHILACGEFEDLLPFDLVKRTLSYEFKNISLIESFEDNHPRVKLLEEIFKKRGMHEFKKVDFAQSIRENINGSSDITPEITAIVEEIRELKNKKVVVDN